MEPDQIIERLASEDEADRPSMEELASAKSELEAAQEALKASIGEHTGTLPELRALRADHETVTKALEAVNGALDEAQAEVDAIKAEVGVTDTVTPTDDDTDDESDDGDDSEDAPEARVPVAASIRESVGRARAHATQRVQVVSEPDDADRLAEVSTTYSLMGKDVETIDPKGIGQAFYDAKRKSGGVKQTVLSVKTDLHPDRTLSGDAAANERKMLDLFGSDPVVPVTAAGGCCSIPTPIYDQPLLGSLGRPIRDAFDVLGASRGAVQAYPPVCIPDEGADVWTCAQDEAVDPEDDSTWKSCVAIECEDSEPTLVEPIYKCLTIGTFQQKFAPEQWEAIVFQTDKLAARLAEARLFNWLAQSATAVYGDTGIATGSTYANFIKTGVRLAAAMRQDQRLGEAQMVWVGPGMIYPAILEDSVTRRTNDADDIEILKAHIDRVLADHGITYVASEDVAAFDNAFSYSGDFPEYPSELPTVMLPAGSAKVLDGGEKNLGIDFVDSSLARQNNVMAFSEFWEGLLVRNCNVVFANVAVEDCTTIACIGA